MGYQKKGARMNQIEMTIIKDGQEKSSYFTKGVSLFSLLQEERQTGFSHCGGKGICGRCKIRFLKGAPLPTQEERKVFSPDELREGFRLACLAKPVRDCSIELHFPNEKEMAIVVSMPEAGRIVGTENGEERETLIAIDLGTTTIAMELRGVQTGTVYATFCTINPQRMCGADVLTRIEAANQGEGEQLKNMVRGEIEKGISVLCHQAEKMGLWKPGTAFLSANTTMGQLFMGYSVKMLGRQPFTPVNIKQNHLVLGETEVVLLPGISAFVGADITAGIYCMKEKYAGFFDENPCLFIDLGTNGEIALGTGEHILTTATAAGPAFEGGNGESIMGADMIACLDTLLQEKKLDKTGLLIEPYFTKGVHVNEVHLKQENVRALQLAKAAVFSGICILIKKCGISADDIHKVYLAGGFGYYLNVKSAVAVGLIPEELEDKVISVGNSSLEGSFLYGKKWIKNKKTQALEQIVKSCETINLANEPEFHKMYINAMELTPLTYQESSCII